MLEHFLPGLCQAINYPLHYQVTNHSRYQRLYGKKLLWHIKSLKLDFIMVIEADSLQITQEKRSTKYPPQYHHRSRLSHRPSHRKPQPQTNIYTTRGQRASQFTQDLSQKSRY